MPTIRRNPPATTANMLDGEQFRILPGPSLLSVYATGATEGDTLSVSVGSNQHTIDATVNLEARSGTCLVPDDQVLFREMAGPGEIFIPLTLTADMAVLVVIEPLR